MYNKKCNECKFYGEKPTAKNGDVLGYCYRYPPKIHGKSGRTSYPLVREKDSYTSMYTPLPIDYVLEACSKFKERDA